MSDISGIEKIFFENNSLSPANAQKIVTSSLEGFDDGELYLQQSHSESFVFDDKKLKSATYNTSKGFGLRSVLGEISAYSHCSEISEKSLLKAADVVTSIKQGSTIQNLGSSFPLGTNKTLYTDVSPLNEVPFTEKISLLEEMDEYLRAKDARVKQVSVSLAGEWEVVEIIRPEGVKLCDIRPLVRLNVTVVAEENGRMEKGTAGAGGRTVYNEYIKPENWKKLADEALRQALVCLSAIDAPAGEMQVVLGSGWPGVLLHEAVGHGLEGDFNRKKTSTFSEMMGKQVAARGVTVIDDGTIPNRRGSLSIDDEGTPTQKTTLIDDGILVGYMQDRMNARLMGVKPTGNGRRESYSCQPMPRMTNTFMLSGNQTRDELIGSVKKGVYAANFGGGQVDIVSGKFVFSASEAYLIEDGKITSPIKGATLVGNGPDVMKKIVGIGNDLELDPGIGTCGKGGQSVPVGVGQPSLLISSITVGGTQS